MEDVNPNIVATTSASAAAVSSPGDTRSAPKFTRCRTGCLRCRKRRRKCDEGKPRCQNCIDKNFDCHYGLQVTFLPKNSITITAARLRASSTLETVKTRTNTSYDKIKFVGEDTLSTDSFIKNASSTSVTTADRSQLSPSPIGNTTTTSFLGTSQGNYVNNDNVDNVQDSSEPTFSTAPTWSAQDNHCPERTPGPSQSSQVAYSPPVINISDKDEFAIRGLLALGTRPQPKSVSTGIPPTTSSEPVEGDVSPVIQSSLVIAKSIAIPKGDTVRGIGITSTGVHSDPPHEVPLLDSPSTAPLSTLERTKHPVRPNSPITPRTPVQELVLLQHYRYHVAPWLDICDLRHSFGIIALQMAVQSKGLLSALMELSQACVQNKTPGFGQKEIGLDSRAETTTPSKISDKCSTNNVNIHDTEAWLLYAFEQLRYLVSDLSDAWANMTVTDLGSMEYLVPDVCGMNIKSAIYWMFLRLDLGIALANNIPIRIPLPTAPIPDLSLLCRTEDTHERVGNYAQVLLCLCGKVLVLCHQETMVNQWLQVFEELNQWHCLRPQEFQPMVEVGVGDQILNPDSQFPLILYTNGAGVFCNLLYHTAMLLLLGCKPRTALRSTPQSPNMSPLWHAQRVCGIALNNDRQESWDPCLLASFLVAAKYMTHESQQQEVLLGIHRIEQITGWAIPNYITQLREDWSFFEGVE